MTFREKINNLCNKKEIFDLEWHNADTVEQNSRDVKITKKYNHKDLARELGIHPRVLDYYLSGDRKPDLRTARKMSEIFNVPLDYLFLDESDFLETADGEIEHNEINIDIYKKLHKLFGKADIKTLSQAEAFMDFLLTQNKTTK